MKNLKKELIEKMYSIIGFYIYMIIKFYLLPKKAMHLEGKLTFIYRHFLMMKELYWKDMEKISLME